MTPKQKLYLSLTDQIAPLWQADETMSETDPATWQLTREIDDWLVHYGGWTILLEKEPFDVLYQDHVKVSPEQYARNCERLRSLYAGEPADARLGEVGG